MFLRRFPAAAGNYSRTGFAASRIGNSSSGWHVLANAQWRLFVACERSCKDTAGNPAALEAGRRSLRRILQNDDADVPVRETAAVHDPAGPYDAPSKRPPTIEFSAATVSRTFVRRAIHADPVDDHECSGFSGSMVRDRRVEGHHVRIGHHWNIFGNSLAGHSLRSVAPLYGRN